MAQAFVQACEEEIMRRRVSVFEHDQAHTFGTIEHGWITTDRNVHAEGSRLRTRRDIAERRYRRFMDAIGWRLLQGTR